MILLTVRQLIVALTEFMPDDLVFVNPPRRPRRQRPPDGYLPPLRRIVSLERVGDDAPKGTAPYVKIVTECD